MSIREQNNQKVITINVSGSRFDVLRSTLKSKPIIYQKLMQDALWLTESSEWYIERDPEVFRFVHSFLRHQKLHLPLNVCGPYLEDELTDWGISLQTEIERCCVSNVMETKARLKSLHKFENAFADNVENSTIDENSDLSRWRKFRSRVWYGLEYSPTLVYKMYCVIQAIVVVIGIFLFIASSIKYFHVSVNPNMHPNFDNDTESCHGNCSVTVQLEWMEHAEHCCIFVLTVDLFIRLVFCPVVFRFLLNPYTIIDIVALIPYYFRSIYHIYINNSRYIIDHQLRVTDYINFLQVFIIMRVFRHLRRNRGTQVVLYTIKTSFKDLSILFLMLVIATLFFGTMIHLVNRHKFSTIPEGLWWSIVTMTTVGYGDMVPENALGRIVAAVCTIVGVLLLSFIVPILVNQFILYYSHSAILWHTSNQRKRSSFG